MHLMGAYAGVEHVLDEFAITKSSSGIPIFMPAMPNLDASLPSQVDIASHDVPAVADQTPHSDCTKLDVGIPPVLVYLGAANGVDVGIMSTPSLSKTRGRRAISADDATVAKRPDSSSAGIIVGAIVVVFVAVLLFLLLPLYLKRRGRTAQKTPATDEESGISRQAHNELGSDVIKKSSASHSDDLQHEASSGVLSISQRSSKTAVLAAEGEPSDSPQPDLPGTVGDSTTPSDVNEEENQGKPLPMRPPRLLLQPVDGEERQDDSRTMARTSTVKLGARASRGRISMAQSVLPNPWDGDEAPGSAAFERALFKLPSFPPPSALPAASFKTRLPRVPRHPRTTRALSLASFEAKTAKKTRSSARKSAVERVRPSPAPF